MLRTLHHICLRIFLFRFNITTLKTIKEKTTITELTAIYIVKAVHKGYIISDHQTWCRMLIDPEAPFVMLPEKFYILQNYVWENKTIYIKPDTSIAE